MFKYGIFYRVDNFDSTELTIFGSTIIWDCDLKWFTMEQVHKPKLYIFHLCNLGATYPKRVFFVDRYVQMIPNRFEDCMTLKHIIFQTSTIGILGWICVGGCKSMWKVHNCETAT